MLKVFEMTNVGLMSYFLKIEVKQGFDGIFICQKKKACQENIEKVSHEEMQKHKTPMNRKEKFSKDDGADKIDECQQKCLIGCLIYLTTTRLDIIFAVSLLS